MSNFFGANPIFATPPIQGETLLPYHEELDSSIEQSNPAAQLLYSGFLEIAKSGAVFTVCEFRGLFPAVVGDPTAMPAILPEPAELGPVPKTFANLLQPAAAYVLISANSSIFRLQKGIDLYGSGNGFPARCSLLPAGTDVLPEYLTLSASFARKLHYLSTAGLNFLYPIPAYHALFDFINAAGLVGWAPPSIIDVLPVSAAGAPASVPVGMVKTGDANPSYPAGTPTFDAKTEMQKLHFRHGAPIYVLNNCVRTTCEKLLGHKDPTNAVAIEEARRLLGVATGDRYMRAVCSDHNLKLHQQQKFSEQYSELTNKGDFTALHISHYQSRASATSPDPVISSVTDIITCVNNWIRLTCKTCTTNSPKDILFMTNLVQPLISSLTDNSRGSLSQEPIHAVVWFVSTLFEQYSAIFRNEIYNNVEVTDAMRSIFPDSAATIFFFDSTRNQLEAARLNRMINQIPYPFPSNKSPDDIAKENDSHSPQPRKKVKFDDNNSPGSEESASSAKTLKNRAKRQKKNKKDKDLRAAAVSAGLIIAPVNNRTGAQTRQETNKALKGGGSSYCVNHVGSQLITSASFPNGMPLEANCRPCSTDPCTRIHYNVTKQPGQLDKGIANDLIKGVSTFNNPIYKDNFIRIIRFLQAS
jgi:hypothetical protein